jgi:hypothetical protein
MEKLLTDLRTLILEAEGFEGSTCRAVAAGGALDAERLHYLLDANLRDVNSGRISLKLSGKITALVSKVLRQMEADYRASEAA